MKEKNHVVSNEVLSKEFFSQFKTEADASKFLKQLHAQILEKMFEGELDFPSSTEFGILMVSFYYVIIY